MATSRTWSLMVAAAATALIALATASPGLADETPSPPVSVAPNPVVVDEHGVAAVKIANQTGSRLTITISIVDEGGSLVDSGLPSAHSGEPVPRQLAPAETLPLNLRPAAGTGLQLVVAVLPVEGAIPAGSVVRTKLGPAAAATAEPAVKSWRSIWQHGAGSPWGTTDLVPLNGPCSGLDIKAGDGVGVVESDGRFVRVTATCVKADDKTVKLEFDPIAWEAATYKGNLDLTPSDDDTGVVALEVVATSVWWCPAVLLLVGLVIAVCFDRWRKYGRVANSWKSELKDIRQLLATSPSIDEKFRKRAEQVGLPPNVQGWEVTSGATQEIEKLERAVADAKFGRGASLEETGRAVTELRTTLDSWSALPDKLAGFQKELPRLVWVPLVRDEMTKTVLGHEGAWTPEGMRALATEVTAATAFIAGWPDKALDDLHVRSQGLPKVPSVNSLFSELKQLQTRKKAKNRVRDLSEQYEQLELAETLRAGVGAAYAVPPRAPGFLEVWAPSAAAQARSIRWRTTIVDWIFLAVTAVTALLAGMAVLLSDGMFAGPGDVLAALTWGIVTGTVAGPVSEALVMAGASTARLRNTT